MSSYRWSSTFFDFLRFRVPVPLSDWCDKHRIIPPEGGAEPGAWRTSRTPYMRQILDDVTDPTVQQIVVCSGIQLGKTELLLNTCMYHMIHEPAPMLLVEPSDDLVSDIGVDRIDAMIRSTPELRPLFGLRDDTKAKSTKSGQLKQYNKRFPGGYLKLASAHSESDLVSRSIRVIMCDEIDKYPVLGDGSAVDRATGRSSNFVNHKWIFTSSPSTLQNSEIWRRLSGTARYEYQIPCPHCGDGVVWSWSLVQWDKDADGQSDASTARIVCPHCGGVVKGAGAASDTLLATGSWVLAEGDRACGAVGYHMSSLLSPWLPLRDIVNEFLSACHNRDIDRLKTFVTDRLAEPWDDRPAPWHDHKAETEKSRFESSPRHETVAVITAGADVQRDRIEVSFWGWGSNRESWVIRHDVVDGDPSLAITWERFARVLFQPVELADGRKMRIAAACVDSGDGVLTQMVYRFTSQYEANHVVSIKGRGGELCPMFAAPSRRNSAKALLYVLGVDKIKDVLCDRLEIKTRGPGYIHIPEALSGEFWQQLNAEKKESYIERGRTVSVWKQLRDRNEALDCAVYAFAAFELFCIGRRKAQNIKAHVRRRLS